MNESENWPEKSFAQSAAKDWNHTKSVAAISIHGFPCDLILGVPKPEGIMLR